MKRLRTGLEWSCTELDARNWNEKRSYTELATETELKLGKLLNFLVKVHRLLYDTGTTKRLK